MNPLGLLLVGGGLFSICGAVFNWDWFFNHYKARPLVSLIGRSGARAIYGLLGIILTIGGTLITLGILKNAN